MLRLRLTVLCVQRLELRLRCLACGHAFAGPTCAQCPAAARGGARAAAAPFEAELGARVTDGTGEAYLEACGRHVWTLLQASDAIVRGARDATARCGPLVAAQRDWWECLTRGGGAWTCAEGFAIGDAGHAALARLWPSAARWQREVVAHCKPARTPSGAPQTGRAIRVAGKSVPSLRPEKSIGLVACEVTPVNMQMEAERMLAEPEAGWPGPGRVALGPGGGYLG